MKVEDMAGSIFSFSGRNSFGLNAEFLSRFLDPGLDLFSEVMREPALTQEEVEKTRPSILADINRNKERLTKKSMDLFSETIYRDHPYGHDILGSPQSVMKITAKDIRDFYEKWVDPSRMVISVVGDVDPEHVKNRLNELMGDWSLNNTPQPVIEPPTPVLKPIIVEEKIDRAQAHLVIGFLTPGLKSADRYSLRILSSALSGMGGRLFRELRDKQSLAYTVTSSFQPGIDTGTFSFYISFTPEKLEQAKAGLLKIIEEMKNTPITEEELTNAKEGVLGSFEIALQNNGHLALSLALDELYGLGYDYQQKYVDGLMGVTALEVREAARKYLDMDKAVKVIVGSVGYGE